MQGFLKLARPEGFEPPTDRFEADYSIQLSYERIRHKKALHISMQGFLLFGSTASFGIRFIPSNDLRERKKTVASHP